MPAPPQSSPSVPDWTEIRRRYEATDDATADICRDCAISRAELDKARKAGKWRRAQPRPFPAGRKPILAPAATDPTQPVAKSPTVAVVPDDSRPPALAVATSPRGLRARLAPNLSAAGRRALLDRLAAAISLKLEQLERRMTKDLEQTEPSEGASATDHERETRAIGALIDNLGKVTEMETGSSQRAGKSAAASPAADLAGEADRYRRELADRLQKIIDAAGPKP